MGDSSQDYAQLLLNETREDLGRADAKVSVLLSSAGIISSIIVGAIAAGHWRPTQLALWVQVIWWLGVTVASAGIVALASALAPRVRHPDAKAALHYFGHAAQFDSFREFLDTLDEISGERAVRTASQLWLVSRILVRKYKLIRFALVSFGVAAVMLVAAATG
jgi:hypothetical protein